MCVRGLRFSGDYVRWQFRLHLQALLVSVVLSLMTLMMAWLRACPALTFVCLHTPVPARAGPLHLDGIDDSPREFGFGLTLILDGFGRLR
jgi:hypothetical protein